MKTKPMTMLLAMLAGWLNRHRIIKLVFTKKAGGNYSL